MDIFNNDFDRLNFEDFIWIIYIGLALLSIFGDKLQKEFLIEADKAKEKESNNIFLFILVVTFFIYLYFFVRNLYDLEKADSDVKELFSIKLLGSSFFIAGIICLIYFQSKQTNFVGTPL